MLGDIKYDARSTILHHFEHRDFMIVFQFIFFKNNLITFN